MIMKMNKDKYEDFFKDDPWELIKAPCYPSGRRLYLSDERFWVSLNNDGKILFFVHEEGGENIKSLKNLAGVEIKIEKYSSDKYRLCCILTDSEDKDMRDKFAVISKDVAHHCSQFQGALLFIKVQERIKSWANFLKPTRKGLSHAEFIGLWGELYCVSEYLLTTHLASDAVRFWIGPEGKKQDITLDSIAIEVKTSSVGDPRTIKISSLEQLERATDKLYLLHLIMNPSSGISGITLNKIYQKCLDLLSHDLSAEALFLQKISKLYGKASEEQLKEKLSIASIHLYDVCNDFPTITRNDVTQGISSVQYEIFISTIKEFEVIESIKEIIKNG